ncbi:MAG: hypothetical protein JRC90_10760 [Deltaproteobacteria bacterium]|nr:hypothetical protein [Deltaproteobacteria bacterium]
MISSPAQIHHPNEHPRVSRKIIDSETLAALLKDPRITNLDRQTIEMHIETGVWQIIPPANTNFQEART